MSLNISKPNTLQGTLVTDSRLDIECATYHWNVHDFDRICAEPRKGPKAEYSQEVKCLLDIDFIQSPPFHVGQKGPRQTQWNIYLQKEHPGSEYLAVFVYLITSEMPELSPVIKYSFSILSPRGTVLHQKADSTMVQLEMNNSWGEDQFISLSALFGDKDKYLSGNMLRLRFDLEIVHDVIHDIKVCESGKEIGPKNGSMSKCPAKAWLTELWNTKDFFDLLVTSQEGITYTVHKCVLSGASPVFEAMLRTEMNERATSSVHIPDIQDRVVEKMLEYMYTDEIAAENWQNFDFVKVLLHASDKYQLDRLKLQCFNELCDRFLTVDTVSDLVILVHVYDPPDGVKEEIFNFFNAKLNVIEKCENFMKACKECPVAFMPLLRKIL